MFTEDIPEEEGGSISISGAVLEKTDDEAFTEINITAGLIGRDDTYINTRAARFSSLLDREPEVLTEVKLTAALTLTERLKTAAFG